MSELNIICTLLTGTIALSAFIYNISQILRARKLAKTGECTAGIVVKNENSKFGSRPVVAFCAGKRNIECLCSFYVGNYPEKNRIKVFYQSDDPEAFFAGVSEIM